ncbi:MAG TPA: glycosyltransferase family 2 protein, partial [Mycobacteriales bacterium]|nr:glycosyltransferase family 2 protein [Mycobacteriales bacterium]
MPAVSVVVPTHDREGFLTQTLTSVLRQRDVDLEVVVVDDGSRPGLVPAVAAAAGDDRVRVVRHEVAQGVSAARNRGVAAARGRWVAFCDDDDLWAPDKLRAQLAAAGDGWSGWAYTGAVNVDETGRVVGGRRPLPPAEVAALLPGRNAVPGGGSAVLVHRTLLDRAGPFDTRLHNTEDWDLWVRISRLELPRWVPAPMVGYRVHGGGSSLLTRQIVRGAEEIERRYGGPLDRVTLYRHLGRLAARAGRRGEAMRWYARTALRSGRYRRGHLAGDALDLAGERGRRLGRWLRLPQPGSAAPDPAVAAYLSQGQQWLD